MTKPGKKAVSPSICDLAHMADEADSTDVLGSYTGMAQNGEAPVQDVDDL